MKKKQKQNLLQSFWEFVKLQLSGNILFWGGMGGTALFREVFNFSDLWSLAIGNVLAYVAFFLVDKHWVFSDKTGQRKTTSEILRFVIFMSASYFINLVLVDSASRMSAIATVSQLMGGVVDKLYWAQFFVSTFFFTFWNWLGLRYWVFKPMRHAHHYAITLHTRNYRKERHARYQKLERKHATKQKAKRTA